MCSQMLAGVAGGIMNHIIFKGAITHWKRFNDTGGYNCAYEAMIYGEYFPNPAIYKGTFGEDDWSTSHHVIDVWGACFLEAWGTGILMFMILSCVDKNNNAIHNSQIPFVIGFTVAALMSLYAPLTQGGFNPARDLGPRLAAVLVGLGECAIPGPRDGFWAYVVGPCIGAPLGGLVYDLTLGKGLKHFENGDNEEEKSEIIE